VGGLRFCGKVYLDLLIRIWNPGFYSDAFTHSASSLAFSGCIDRRSTLLAAHPHTVPFATLSPRRGLPLPVPAPVLVTFPSLVSCARTPLSLHPRSAPVFSLPVRGAFGVRRLDPLLGSAGPLWYPWFLRPSPAGTRPRVGIHKKKKKNGHVRALAPPLCPERTVTTEFPAQFPSPLLFPLSVTVRFWS